MPHFLSADNGESSRSRSRQRARSEVNEHRSMWDRLSFQKFGSWLKREDEPPPLDQVKRAGEEDNKESGRPHSSGEHTSRTAGLLNRRSSRKVVPGLPRPLTFKRMNSEKRDKLLEVPAEPELRRATSADRRPSTLAKRDLSPPPISVPSISAPDILSPRESESQQKAPLEPTIGGGPDSNIPAGARQVDYGIEEPVEYVSASEPPLLDLVDSFSDHGSHRSGSEVDEIRLQEELEAKWILNLSMHFRDMSDREKFFLTFAEEPNKWRRVTVSCDYRQLEADSLEADLKTLHYQRDKSSRIYEAIRDSLPDIQFYDTVTNLKLQTTDGRLHVHVTEDVNEIIPYPSASAIDHLDCKRFKENAVSFDSHISGFVYKVAVNNKPYIKKEIPGPDAVEEFLYEINALCSLQNAKSVIKFEGVIVDEQNQLIKGLLISYADQGALVDMIYDFKPTGQLHWARREKWARQIVEGLSEIHEAGYVQGDFTLSNIVIDKNDDAKTIDINRRGCPVGWEPPELAKLIESGQRISIYIGVKSDLYQLGMVLWALAEQQDEPERQERPLAKTMEKHRADIPSYFRDVVRACLSELPRNRPSATELLKRFPDPVQPKEVKPKVTARESVSTHRSDKEYIDPATAVNLDDITQHRRHSRDQSSFENIRLPPTDYPASSGSYIMPDNNIERGRSPDNNSRYRRSDCSPYPGHRSVLSLDDSEIENELASLPASRETRWEQIYVDGDTKLVQRGCGEIGVHDFASSEPKEICITTPPGELDSSFMTSKPTDDAPLSFSALLPIEPQLAQTTPQEPLNLSPQRGVGTKASFSDRVHQLAQALSQNPSPNVSPKKNRHSAIPDSAILADLEQEVDFNSSVSTSTAPSRVGTGFSIFDRPDRTVRVGTGFSIAQGHRFPTHQDSGFDEPERVSYESERIRHSLDESIRDLKFSKHEEDVINERLWDEHDGTMFGEGVRGEQLHVRPVTIPAPAVAPPTKSLPIISLPLSLPSVGATNILNSDTVCNKPLEEKVSNTTIRPPSILIPEFHHSIPKALDTSPPMDTPSSNHQTNFFTEAPEVSPSYISQHDYLDERPPSRDVRSQASSDLDDYLSHSISYPQHGDLFGARAGW
jgi:serine/threonine protein kinase